MGGGKTHNLLALGLLFIKNVQNLVARLRTTAESYLHDQSLRELRDRIRNQFGSALRETFSTLYYPSAQRLMSADFPMEFTANKYDGEDQIIRTLKGKMKYTEEVSGETFIKKVEARLFTQTLMLWSEIRRRAATKPRLAVAPFRRPGQVER